MLKINGETPFPQAFFLGVDTSCYTTSFGVVDEQGRIIKDLRRILKVKPGEKGLRQSEALFQHLNNLPELIEEAAPFYPLQAVAYSARPRPVSGSYLPVFLAGGGFARAISASTSVPLISSSHQEGHIRAAMEGTGLDDDEFLGVHLSGGTTELLFIKKEKSGFAIELMGGTTDLHAGQMVDRVGVALGLPFPAGPHLEHLAREGKATISLPVSVQGLDLSFSGPTSAALRELEKGAKPEDLALAVLDCLVESIFRLLREGRKIKAAEKGSSKVLIFGGVASNSYLRRELKSRLSKDLPAVELFFGEAVLSSDNAIGLAFLARDHYLSLQEKGRDHK